MTLVTLCNHLRHEAAQAMNNPPLIHSYQPLIIIFGLLPQMTTGVNSRVITQHLDTAETIDARLAQCSHRFTRADIRQHADSLGAQCRHFSDSGVQFGLLNIGQHYIHALSGKHLGQLQSDPACRARDHGGLVLEFLHRFSPALLAIFLVFAARRQACRPGAWSTNPNRCITVMRRVTWMGVEVIG